ncbi:putative tetratricopeptide-like helical domain superfamily [Helianthus annuus]|uniref:Putative tetratricopeptide-like helical domain-containing protein n=1 Tax=Helianthus annuus TaxID=4232 RepID=A0A251TZP5_HELAN|nr:putative tetratricopeptide-like helical domain superfamily [Helianthus annuus]KAJ0561764.1 putative tetratricopeptide-like helical domain superfamily [Helianthus annuus]KAJ0568521.1 putative tetratricopeptide-like helical domain superfamily [Helianthus annuus]KAJ0574828.1 putative tetratricopeptide-like helical domain superfamily [Helianthus annuus]KAJ0739159.1 putative tetratricopeptide-like helical domain superfamily [Helianthus annuus]
MQFDEVDLEIHSAPASLEEAADRRLICEAKGDYESALEHLVLANRQDNEVAAIDLSIGGNIYLSLSRFLLSKTTYCLQSLNHPAVASVFVRLADLYYKLRKSTSYCENALRIYAKPVPGTTPEDIASGMTEISAIYESFNEPEETLKLLQKSMKLLEDKPGQQSTIAGVGVSW